MSRPAMIAGVVAFAALIVVAFFWMAPGTGPELQRSRPAKAAAAAVEPPAAPPEAVAAARPEGGRAKVKAGARREVPGLKQAPVRSEAVARRRPSLDDRLMHRSQNLDEVTSRIATYAEENGWSDETLATVSGALEHSHAQVNAVVARVDGGEIGWDEAREEMAEIRAAQSKVVRLTLGDEAFEKFEKDMMFGGAKAHHNVRPLPGGRKLSPARPPAAREP